MFFYDQWLYFIKDLKHAIFFIPFVLILLISDLYRHYKFKGEHNKAW